ncbi:pyruvate kinase alpha/beta domain-containing protein [Methanobacterium sp.]|uniref:pyruvate kinase alpha/beta domain-containing protein n=1 Tax=Methanobacterium sp. TaxID=2164 RepID=UPI003C777D93
MEKSIYYFESPGEQNTDKLVELVKQRKEELGIKNIVVASVSGKTALKLKEVMDDIDIVSITHHTGFKEKGKMEITEADKNKLKEKDITFYTGSHALSGVGRGISNKFGGVTPVEIIAATLRLFGQGIKVCVEVTIMAADAGLIPMDSEIIAIGGTAWGADAAVVLEPAHMNNFFDLKIKEIIAMPRS